MLPALVLNADYRPLSLFPLSVWDWRDVVSAVVMNRVDVVDVYDFEVRSPSTTIQLPSVIALRHYENMNRPAPLTRANLFVRDNWTCQFCNTEHPTDKLTFDHVLPRSRGGSTSWINLVAACGPCNLQKKDRTPKEAKMRLLRDPFHPTVSQLMNKKSMDKLKVLDSSEDTRIHSSWRTWLGLSDPAAFPTEMNSADYWGVTLDE